MKVTKHSLAMILATLIILSSAVCVASASVESPAFSQGNFAERNRVPEVTEQGKCGDNLTWTIDENERAVITGTGAMYDYREFESPFGDKYERHIKELVLQSGITYIGAYAFYYCFNLETVVIPDTVTKMGSGAFGNCKGLKRVKLSKNLTDIPREAFGGDEKLEEIIIPDSVQSIGQGAFGFCENLEKVFIGSGVQSIGMLAFYDASTEQYVDIYYAGNLEQWEKIDKSIIWDPVNYEMHFNCDVSVMQDEPAIPEDTDSTVPDNTTTQPVDKPTPQPMNIIQRIIQWVLDFFAKIFGR